MFKGILGKLLFSHFIVLAVPLAALAVFGLIFMESAIKTPFEKDWKRQLDALGAQFKVEYAATGSFEAAYELLEKDVWLPGGAKLGKLAPEQVRGEAMAYVPGERGDRLRLLLPVKAEKGNVIGGLELTASADILFEEISKVRKNILLTLLVALLFSAYIAFLFSRHMTAPLRQLTGYARAIADGKSPDLPEPKTRDEIATLSRAFQHMTDRLQERMDYIREFASALTHELKTPLTSIIGSTEILIDGAMEDEAARKKFMNNISQESRHLRSIVEDILVLARLESESVPFEFSEADMGAFVKEVVSKLKHRAEEKGLELTVQGADEAGKAEFDSWRMEQVIENLFSNAVKFTPRGGRVTVSAKRKGNSVEVAVSDTGEGIEPDDRPHVFDRFFTRPAPESESDSIKGTGLGLAIVKGIVEAHKGSISVESEPGKGAAFTVTLPASRS